MGFKNDPNIFRELLEVKIYLDDIMVCNILKKLKENGLYVNIKNYNYQRNK